MKSIPPVEAVKYVSVSVKKQQKRKKSNRGAGQFKMAWHNVFRGKKRAVLVFTSLFLGLLNFVNITITSIWGRRNELAIMESIGMTGKQVRTMLIFEGGIYAMITCGWILTVSSFVLTLLFYIAGSTGAYINTSYPFSLIATVIVSIFIIYITIPLFAYQTTNKQSVVERLVETQNL